MKNYKDVWKELARAKNISELNVAQYCLIKAAKAKSNNKIEIAETLLRRAFTPVTNQTKLLNGREPWDTLQNVLQRVVPYMTWRKTILDTPWEEILTYEEKKTLENIWSELTKKKFKDTEQNWLYIFVRQDLAPEYQAVQAAHAVFKAGTHFPESNADETYFCLVGVPNLEELLNVESLLSERGACFVGFREPDIGDELTAIATRPMKAHKRSFLRHFPRLVFKGSE